MEKKNLKVWLFMVLFLLYRVLFSPEALAVFMRRMLLMFLKSCGSSSRRRIFPFLVFATVCKKLLITMEVLLLHVITVSMVMLWWVLLKV